MTALEALARSIQDIEARVRQHEWLLRCLNEGSEEEILRCCTVNCPHKELLKKTLLETVETLEESRKSFKSRRLEILRKRLLGVLAEIA